MPPAPPLGLPLGLLAPYSGHDPNLGLCRGSPWLSTSINGDWDGLFQAVGVIWPLRSAAVAVDYGKGFDELHIECEGSARLDIDVHIPILAPLGKEVSGFNPIYTYRPYPNSHRTPPSCGAGLRSMLHIGARLDGNSYELPLPDGNKFFIRSTWAEDADGRHASRGRSSVLLSDFTSQVIYIYIYAYISITTIE